MYQAPEVYYNTVYRENERELERRLAYRLAAEQDPQRVTKREQNRYLAAAVTALRGLVARLRPPKAKRKTRTDAAAGGTVAC